MIIMVGIKDHRLLCVSNLYILVCGWVKVTTGVDNTVIPEHTKWITSYPPVIIGYDDIMQMWIEILALIQTDGQLQHTHVLLT